MAKKNFTKLAEGDVKGKASFFDTESGKTDYRTLGAKHIHEARLIPIGRVIPDPDQPRKTFDDESIDSLADSIKTYGILQPLNVRYSEDDDVFLIINGERRFRASKKAGLSDLPCMINESRNDGYFEKQLIENLQREDLPVLEEASGIKTLLSDHHKTQTEAAKIIGKSQPYISTISKILDLPQKILEEIPTAKPSKDFLFHLVKIKDPQKIDSKWEAFKNGGLEAKDLKKEVAKKPKRGRPKIKPWKWKNSDFTVSIKFKKNDPDNEEVIEALEKLLNELREK
jgi:ParB family chromosome partitioning protein